ncbi:hypothetical protein [Streptomyces sp. XD-27]|uniref:hypothetical protein n=1 Tax=Streptomyces sp. XD-27 TaxID=3062779 RepID=UPI0026F45EC8|nr:hypothetical protein [Streptomyces sp. XD-27]WKX72594.1 hypothetical protein Q3Y56_24225 [Streptomyces sp. XD-27]
MDLTPYVDSLRYELAVAADAGGDEARALADRLTAPLESAARLTLLNALSAAMDQVNQNLAPGSVVVQLRGIEPEFVVTPPPAPAPVSDAGPGPVTDLAPGSDPAPALGPAAEARWESVGHEAECCAPGGHIRLRFADASSLESAAALFVPAVRDDDALALRIPSDGGISTLRAVLAALDSASIEAEALTVHTPDLDDVFVALTGVPQPGGWGSGR